MRAKKKSASKIGPQYPKGRSPREERELEAKRLNRLAAQLRTAADAIDLAAEYWRDGAYTTARGILTQGRTVLGMRGRSASSRIMSVARSLNGERWAIKT